MANTSLRSRRGLRVLLWALSIFAFGQLGGGLLLDYCWPELRFPEVGRVLGNLRVQEHMPEVVCMGSSRSEGGFRSYIIDHLLGQFTRQAPRTFNAALNGGDAVVANWLLDRMLREGRHPELLVLEVSPEFLSRRTPLLSQQVLRQMTWLDLPRYLPDAILFTHPMRLVTSRIMPLYMHRYEIRKQLILAASGKPASSRPDTSVNVLDLDQHADRNLVDLPPNLPVPPAPPHVSPNPAQLTYLSACLKDFQLSKLETAALERLLRRCRGERIEVLLVGFPLMERGRALHTPEIDRVFLSYVHDLTTEYGCRFVDMRNRIPDYGFGDGLHVNDLGGEYFSQILAREVLIPMWRELHP
jgi:hypothetical protein